VNNEYKNDERVNNEYKNDERVNNNSNNNEIVNDNSNKWKRCNTPMLNTVNLRKSEPNVNNDSLLPITGKLRFVADRCRPDILVATGEISCGGDKNPSDEHIKTAERTVKYLKMTKDLGVIFNYEEDINLFGYSDASYNTEGMSKCRLGGCVFMGYNSGAIMSYSRCDTITSIPVPITIPPNTDIDDINTTTLSHSSCEAEIKAVDMLIREIIHIRDMLKFLGYDITTPTPVYVDNKSAITLCELLKSNHKTKHINMRINFIRECINSAIVSLYFIPSDKNVADMLTKPLQYKIFVRHRTILLNGHNGINPYKNEYTSYTIYNINEDIHNI
jgi:hypothetical protein